MKHITIEGAKTFIENISTQFPKFYHDAGRLLTKWIAQASKIKEKEPEEQEPAIPTIFSDIHETVPIENTEVNLAAEIA